MCRNIQQYRVRTGRATRGPGSFQVNRDACREVLKQIKSIYKAQRGLCVGCEEPISFWDDGKEKACIDHDHYSTEVRGLLCNGCNYALGCINDCPRTLLNLAAYIAEHNQAQGESTLRQRLASPAAPTPQSTTPANGSSKVGT